MWSALRERLRLIIAIAVLVGGFLLVWLANRPAPTPQSSTDFAKVNFDSGMVKGNKSAAVSLVQYSDFLCPSCSYLSTQIMPTVEKDYIDTGKVAFEFRPMAFIAPGSTIAAEGGYCAIDQHKFWEYHDAMYTYVWDNAFSKGIDPTRTTILTTDIVKSIAASTTLNTQKFDSCLDSGTYASSVSRATSDAHSHGVTSTPYVMVNGTQVTGSMSVTSIETLIRSQL